MAIKARWVKYRLSMFSMRQPYGATMMTIASGCWLVPGACTHSANERIPSDRPFAARHGQEHDWTPQIEAIDFDKAHSWRQSFVAWQERASKTGSDQLPGVCIGGSSMPKLQDLGLISHKLE